MMLNFRHCEELKQSHVKILLKGISKIASPVCLELDILAMTLHFLQHNRFTYPPIRIMVR